MGFCALLLFTISANALIDLSKFKKNGVVVATVKGSELSISWPTSQQQKGIVVISLDNENALLSKLALSDGKTVTSIVEKIDPEFLLTIGKRDLISQNGWNIFFDKVPFKPHSTHRVQIEKKSATVTSVGSRTVIAIDRVSAPGFNGTLEITLYNGSPLVNIAAVISTQIDSTAIVYDAGLINRSASWQRIAWSDTDEKMQSTTFVNSDTAINRAVKYRTIVGETKHGSVAVFPAPHQYFYPLDEAFNLKFVWHGINYRKMIDGYGLGIRQDLYGDNRFVPWFNAPPQTKQRLNFFFMLSKGNATAALSAVKKFTNNDRYVSLTGHKTLSSHFHNEFVMKVIMAGKPVPDTPSFIKVFKRTGIDIVHLGEFHYTAHPKGPDETRLKEMKALFDLCERSSDKEFLLLPGEEPNEFLGGHWLQIFPRPVYWIMSRKENQPFVTQEPQYGTVYRIGNAKEMLDLLEKENGLAWTAHPRTKGSTGYPDKYKTENFFTSKHFLGAAWKPMPADLSLPRLGKRVLDLLDDMNNWGAGKKILAEADLFTIEPENEMYAHLNVNYLQLDRLPQYKNGWQPVLNALQKGRFFSTTGEVLIPSFTINNIKTGDTLKLAEPAKAMASFQLQWTFPMQFAEIITGDGKNVERIPINLDHTTAFGSNTFRVPVNLTGKKWARLEAWDIAANGAFTQTIWIE